MKRNLYGAFLAYHQANPRVYQLVNHFAEDAMRRGHSQYGIAAIWEKVRWEITVNTRSNIESEFKMPNNHRAYYARMWLKDHPDHPDFFKTAELRRKDAA